MNISSDFVKKCKGLPLEIVAIGSLLDDKEKTPFEWEIIRQSLSSEMEKKSTFSWYIAKILGFSCDDFPYCLKLCFFYFGIYLEDYEVQSTRLIRQWIAEALVKDKDGKTLEDVAQQYLTKLIGRSLVQVSSFSIDGVVVFLKKFSASVFIFFFHILVRHHIDSAHVSSAAHAYSAVHADSVTHVDSVTHANSASHANRASMSCTRANIPSTIFESASYVCSSSVQSWSHSHHHFLQQVPQHCSSLWDCHGRIQAPISCLCIMHNC